MNSLIDLNRGDHKGNTALIYAVEAQSMPIVVEVCQAGAHINISNNMGRTPLHYAALSNNLDYAQYLLDRFALPFKSDKVLTLSSTLFL